MSSVINTNIFSLQGQNALRGTNNDLQTSLERLSTGLRINSAKDDAAGLAISNRLTTQIRGSEVASRNANDGISLAQTAEGAMGALSDTMQRMRDLAVQSANASNDTEDRENLNTEFGQLKDELNRIVEGTEFNGLAVLNGDVSNALFQVGANNTANDRISVTIGDLAGDFADEGIGSVQDLDVDTVTNAQNAIDDLDTAIQNIDTSRAKLGAVQNRFEVTIDNLSNFIVNESAARSRIQDADFAKETADLSKAQILQQAGTSVLTQANQAPQSALGLLG